MQRIYFKKVFIRLILIGALLGILCPERGFSQVTITGQSCVVHDIIYLYRINGDMNNMTPMQIAVMGGTLLRTASTSYVGAPLSFIRVKWNSNAKTGSILVKSSLEKAVLDISIADALQPGEIDSSDKVQEIKFNSLPAGIHCSGASGGGCSPSYLYQWQRSTDATHWSDIANAHSQNLTFFKPIKSATFYRRKVVQTISGSVSYSNIAAIYVTQSIPQNVKEE